MSFYALARVFFIFANYYYENGLEGSVQFEISTRLAYLSGILSMGFLIYGLEMHFLKTKGFISLVPLIHSIVTIVIPYDILRPITYVTNTLYLVIVLALYFYIVIKTTGTIKRNSILSILGFTILYLGISIDSRWLKVYFSGIGLRFIPFIFGPILVIIGLTTFYLANRSSAKAFAR